MSDTQSTDLPHDFQRRHAADAICVGSFDRATNSIEVCWSTGAKVRRFDWRSGQFYDEELVVSPNAIRTERLEAGAPFLNTHASYSLGAILGAVVPGSIRFENGAAFCRIRLSQAADVADAIQKIREGSARHVSVGYVCHRIEKTERDDGEIALWRVVDWEPHEISSVPIPADAGAQVRALPVPNSHDQDRRRADGASMTTSIAAAQTPANNDQTRAAVEAERERAAAIIALADKYRLRSLGEKAIRDGIRLEKFRELLLDELVDRQERELPNLRPHTGAGGPANPVSRAAAVATAILHRSAPNAFSMTDDARQFWGKSLLELARDSLEAHGISTVGLPRHEIAERALAGSTRSGGMHSTSDFPFILANVANKTLRRGYEQGPQTFRPLVSVTTTPDFKTISRVQLGEAPAFERVNESGEFKRGSMAEGREQYALATYGKVVAITRQVILNDDLAAFTRLPTAFGLQAANLESDLVWAQIVGNPEMGDGKTLFHAEHGNLAGTGAGLSVDSLGLARAAMRMQKGVDGATLLNITPTHVIAPVNAETKLAQLLTSITPAVPANAIPEYIRALTPIIEPSLDGGFRNPATGQMVSGSQFAWYLAATNMMDLIELCYLEGTQGVFTETRTGFDVDGVEVKVRMDVGAKVIDWRPFYRNPATSL